MLSSCTGFCWKNVYICQRQEAVVENVVDAAVEDAVVEEAVMGKSVREKLTTWSRYTNIVIVLHWILFSESSTTTGRKISLFEIWGHLLSIWTNLWPKTYTWSWCGAHSCCNASQSRSCFPHEVLYGIWREELKQRPWPRRTGGGLCVWKKSKSPCRRFGKSDWKLNRWSRVS